MKYKVIKSYRDAPDDPISVSTGETLEYLEESDPQGDWPNWVYCRGKKKKGWIPRQILEINGTMVSCSCDYSAREHTLSLGEILISEEIMNGWSWCFKEGEEDCMAWAPLNHLLKIEGE